jgi:hypothetical protein
VSDGAHLAVGPRGIDLAAGMLWAAPIMLAAGVVDCLHYLEYSNAARRLAGRAFLG